MTASNTDNIALLLCLSDMEISPEIIKEMAEQINTDRPISGCNVHTTPICTLL
jgi:hypothetical protein